MQQDIKFDFDADFDADFDFTAEDIEREASEAAAKIPQETDVKDAFREQRAAARFEKRRLAQIGRFDDIGIPGKDEQWRLVTTRAFNAFSMLDWLIANGRGIVDLNMVIFSTNMRTVQQFIKQSKYIAGGAFIISSYEKGFKTGHEWIHRLADFLESNPAKWEYTYIKSHAKIISLQTDRGEFITLEGSGNLTANGEIEQYCYENSEQIYRFHRSWIRDTIENGLPKGETRWHQ